MPLLLFLFFPFIDFRSVQVGWWKRREGGSLLLVSREVEVLEVAKKGSSMYSDRNAEIESANTSEKAAALVLFSGFSTATQRETEAEQEREREERLAAARRD